MEDEYENEDISKRDTSNIKAQPLDFNAGSDVADFDDINSFAWKSLLNGGS